MSMSIGARGAWTPAVMAAAMLRRSHGIADAVAATRMQSSLAHRVFEDTSSGVTPTKTALVMHGILGMNYRKSGVVASPGNKLNWRTFSMKLAAANPDWRFVALDHRGHGDSPSFSAPHTIDACANDVIKLADELDCEPDAVFGHSFGGKVALQYLETCHKQSRKLPSQVWVLDSLPGTGETDYKNRKLTASIENVLPRLKEIPLPIHSKSQLIKDLTAKGIGLGEAQWLTTNLRLINSQPEQYDWKMDVPVIEELFQAFLVTDLWPVVRKGGFEDDVQIHFVHAEKNKMWTPQILSDLENLESENVYSHLLAKSGHWVHIDNPNGLLEIIQNHF